MDPLDWSLIRSFLAVAEAGSLSAAARQTGISQPTLGRHIRALEGQLGAPLFSRTANGQALTDAADGLLPEARAMRDAAARLVLAATARQPSLSGTVRLTSSRVVAHHLLPPLLAQLRHEEPGIDIDLVASDATENLLFHEADIALRMYRPTQPDLISRHLGDLPVGIYAAPAYLDRHGRPETVEALLALDFVGFDRSELIIRMMAGVGISWERADFPLRCDDQLVHWSLVRAGCGVGGMQCGVADHDPAVERIAPFVTLPSLPLWITTAVPLSQNLRLRRVWDHLVKGLAQSA